MGGSGESIIRWLKKMLSIEKLFPEMETALIEPPASAKPRLGQPTPLLGGEPRLPERAFRHRLRPDCQISQIGGTQPDRRQPA